MTKEKINVLKKRLRIFNKLIKIEEAEEEKLKYKSRRIRLNNPNSKRRTWYIDRKQELQLTIRLLEGSISEDEFIHYLLDDKYGELFTLVGDITGNQ